MLAVHPPETTAISPVASVRRIVHRTGGRSHGPITRLVSPSDLGERLKPFVFLDLIDARDLSRSQAPALGLHPHSGIATLTWLLEGAVDYEDDQGREGSIEAGWMEWMQAGSGAWHGGGFGDSDRLRGFQLWLALPPALELAAPFSRYFGPEQIRSEGPVTVLLGAYGAARSPIDAPAPINYFSVKLRAGESWRFQPPPGHDVAWAAVSVGSLRVPEAIGAGELVVFEEGGQEVAFFAREDTEFVFGTAARHPYPLATGYYSVHTSPQALKAGEARIRELGKQIRAAGSAG